MKLRLSVGDGSGPPTIHEYFSPLIRIGRDDGCELMLNGNGVSRQHAQVVLSAGSATVADAGSSNGTLLNGAMIDRAAPLHVGDQIQLGYTGPTLTVLELDLTPPPASAPAASQNRVLIGSVAGGLAAVALGVALLVVLFHKPATPEGQGPDQAMVVIPHTAQPEQTKKPPEEVKRQEPPPKPPVTPVKAADPAIEVKPVGSYVSLKNWVSVLLQRQGEGYPWLVLRGEARIPSDCTLVSLPGYRSLITLDTGVRLTLWGNVPEFSAFPPVLESVVLLHAPSAGTDLDFALDRGRVVLANAKPSGGAAQARVRFLNQTWDLELPSPKSEVALELWSPPGGPPAGSTEQVLPTYLGVFSKGGVRIRMPSQTVELPAQARLTWTTLAPAAPLTVVPLKQLPAWWTTPPDRKADKVQKALLSLLDWSAKLGGSNIDRDKLQAATKSENSVVSTIKTQIEEKSDPDDKDLGISFLAALEEVEPLVDFLLNDRQHSHVRGTALFALQSWLGRGSSHATTLAGILERRGLSRDKVQRVLALMHVYSPQALEEKQTYVDLVANLGDENLLLRDLAFWQLDRLGVAGLLPPEVKNFPAYDPAAEADKRKPAVAAWKKLLAEGKLPYRGGNK